MTHSRVPRWFTEGLAVYEETANVLGLGRPVGLRSRLNAIHALETPLGPGYRSRIQIHPEYPAQVTVSYLRRAKFAILSSKSGATRRFIAMVHDFAELKPTPEVIELEFKMKPGGIRPPVSAWMDAQTKRHRGRLRYLAVKNSRALLRPSRKRNGTTRSSRASAFGICIRIRRCRQCLRISCRGLDGKGEKAKQMAELERYSKIGGRDPATLKQLAQLESEPGRKRKRPRRSTG